MIKRDGVALMNARTKNVSLARETLEVIKRKNYTAPNGMTIDVSSAIDAAIKGTNLYRNVVVCTWEKLCEPIIEVVNETTAHAAARLLADNKQNIVALNFASARSVGGGFLAGAIAQEEDLCRCSALYACTKSKPMFYNENILCDNSLYTDNIIYSPNVPFFRDEYNQFLEQPFELSIISAPAPNISSMKEVDKDSLFLLLYKRALKILHVAAVHGHDTIILGAWGCGAFGNDPEMVATAFMEALHDVPAFKHICFAVYDNRDELPIFTAFKQFVLGE